MDGDAGEVMMDVWKDGAGGDGAGGDGDDDEGVDVDDVDDAL